MSKASETQNSIKSKINFHSNLIIIALALSLFILFKSYIIILITGVYLFFFQEKKDILVYILLLLLLVLRIDSTKHINGYYYVYNIKPNYTLCVNGYNKIKLHSDEYFRYGEILKLEFNDYEYIKDLNQNKNGIYYKVKNADIKHIRRVDSLRAILFSKVKDSDNVIKMMLNKELFHNYPKQNDNDFFSMNISWNLCFIACLKLLNKYFKNKHLNLAILSVILFIFIGINYSSIRIVIIELTLLLFKERINALGCAMIIMLMINPYSIYSYSFILPFLIRINFRIASPFSFKTLLMLMQSYFFGEVNLFANLLFRTLSYFKALFIIFNSLLLIFNINLEYNLLSKLSDYLFEYLNCFVIRGQISIIFIVLLFYLFKRYKIKANNLQMIIVLLVLLSNISNPFMKVSFINVGQGDAELIKTAFNNEVILIDTGSEYNYHLLKRYLLNEGIYKIDKLVISHGDSDHDGNMVALAKDFIIDEIVYEHIDVKTKRLKLISLNTNKYDNKNDNSLVHYLEIDGLSFLFTGDISKTVEDDLFKNRKLNIDILKLGHHGSKTSTSDTILRNNNIKLATISTNGRYNHPSSETLNRLRKYKIDYLSTKDKGDIEIIFTTFSKFIKCSSGDFVIMR